MKTVNHGWVLTILSAAFIFSCDDDPIGEEGTNGIRITVQFETGTKQIAEDAGEETVVVKLDKPLIKDAVLTLKAGEVFTENMSTIPPVEDGLIMVPLAKGQSTGTLKLVPIDNTRRDGDRVADLKLHHLSVPYIAGPYGSLKVTIIDDESTGGVESLANFIPQDLTLEETNTAGVDYQVHFSEAVAVDSEIRISLSSEKGVYGSDYASLPAADDNIISLPVSAGSRVVSFTLRPLNNNYITGELNINLTITETTGSIRKGNILQQVLKVKDDELAGKPRGYEVTAGASVVKRFYEYDGQGRISKVNWENYSPYMTHGTDTYYYDASNQLVRINKAPGREVLYHWTNGRVSKSETLQDGATVSYSDYAYDEQGNLAGVVSYYAQDDASFSKGMYTVFLYFTDGNLYKSITYQDNVDPEAEPYIVSTRTYDNYLDSQSPFDMTEVLPTVRMQRNLATTYRLEQSGIDQTYHMVYEFRADGLPAKRIATATGDMQTAVYHYY